MGAAARTQAATHTLARMTDETLAVCATSTRAATDRS